MMDFIEDIFSEKSRAPSEANQSAVGSSRTFKLHKVNRMKNPLIARGQVPCLLEQMEHILLSKI